MLNRTNAPIIKGVTEKYDEIVPISQIKFDKDNRDLYRDNDTDYFNKYRQIWQDAYNVLPDPQNDPEKWLRNALKNDYFTKYQKDIVNLARLKVEASILKDKLINN